MASPSQPKSLIFDLEVAPGKADQPDRIIMVGALRPDTGEELERKVDKDLPSVLDALDLRFGRGQGESLALPNAQTVFRGQCRCRCACTDFVQLARFAHPSQSA
jgi:hypothetical protein